MNFISKIIPDYFTFISPVPEAHSAEFLTKRFSKNTRRILLISIFLFFEQIFYGIFLSHPGSLLQKIHLLSASAMILFAGMSFLFTLRPPQKIKMNHKLFEISLAFFGMLIALRRFVLTEESEFHIPTIYIAVVYGIAVVFYFSFLQSSIIYLLFTILTLILISITKIHISERLYIADIISNTFIAWVISFTNYRNLKSSFVNRKLIEEKNIMLHELSEKDSLTGLYNRRKLEEILKRTEEHSKRFNEDYSVIIVDIDYFKKINDSLGHDKGDSVLKIFSQILLSNIRNVDDCGRWGGEEFIIVCPASDVLCSSILAERLRYEIESADFNLSKKITASFGIASRKQAAGIYEILKLADERLYKAKAKGRNRVEYGTS